MAIKSVEIRNIKDTMIVTNVPAGRNEKIYATTSSYMQMYFNPAEKVPSDAVIKMCKLNVTVFKQTLTNYSDSALVYNVPFYLDLYKVNDNWDEYTVTSNNAPKIELIKEKLATLITRTDVPFNYSIDLTPYIESMKYGFAIKINSNLSGVNAFPHFEISSSEGNPQPYVTVEYIDYKPVLPTITSPITGEVFNKNEVSTLRVTWDSIGQVKYNLQYSQDNVNWTNVEQTSTNKYHDLSLATIIEGNLYLKLRIADSDGVYSDFTPNTLIQLGARPTTPTVTVVGATTSTPKITWGAIANQYGYQAQVLQGETIIDDSGEVNSTANEYNLKVRVLNNIQYTGKAKIKNKLGIWSNLSTIAFTTTFTTPPIPTFNTVINSSRGFIKLNINNPAPSIGEEQALYNEVFRREHGSDTWLRIAENVTTEFEDFTVEHKKDYEYLVRAIGQNGYRDSAIKIAYVAVLNSQLALVSDFNNRVELLHAPQKTLVQGRKGTITYFVGREYPVTDWLEEKEGQLNASFEIHEKDTLDKFLGIVSAGETLLFRDSRGKKMYCTIPEPPTVEDVLPDYYKVSFTAYEVDYSEGV